MPVPIWKSMCSKTLFQMNEPAFALERMKQRYAKMMDYPEYTTLFEGWGIGPDGFGRRYDQPCMEWWPSYVAESESVRYRTYLSRFSFLQGLSPNGTLTEASATVDTHFGKIEVSLKRKGKKIQATLSVPEERQPKSSGPMAPARISIRGAIRRNM